MNIMSMFHDLNNLSLIIDNKSLYKKACGWNGREINVYPFIYLYNNTDLSFNDLKKIKLYDCVFLHNTLYLVTLFKVNKYQEIKTKDKLNKEHHQWLLHFALLKCIDMTIESSNYLFIPPEGLPAIEKYNKYFFQSIITNFHYHLNGIIIDHQYLVHFSEFNNSIINEAQRIFNCEKMIFISFDDNYQLRIINIEESIINNMDKKKILLPKMKEIEKINCIIQIHNIIKKLPKTKHSPYKNSFSLMLEHN